MMTSDSAGQLRGIVTLLFFVLLLCAVYKHRPYTSPQILRSQHVGGVEDHLRGNEGINRKLLYDHSVQDVSAHLSARHGDANMQALSAADLYTRAGAAQEIVRAQEAQKGAAAAFVQAVLHETAATRLLVGLAQFSPDNMTAARSAKEQMAANEAEIKRLGELVEAAGRSQMRANAVYLQEGQNRYKAVKALKAELAKDSQDDYDRKAAVLGTLGDRFDPTSEAADEYDPDNPKQDNYHVARLTGVDVDDTKSLCGIAEVKHDNTWGTICYSGFTQESAEIFCKTMGLSGASARYTDGTKPTWNVGRGYLTIPLKPAAQPSASVIWMNEVKCTGSETNVLECPFVDDKASSAQDRKDYSRTHSACNEASSVGLCCDVSQFCPPRSKYRPDAEFATIIHPEMVANCKCDTGFYMETSSVFSGKCTSCPINACAPFGSASLEQCLCLEGFYKNAATGGCLECPANSCSARGVDSATGVNGCKCFAGYYMSGGECVMCPEARTSKAGSSSVADCDMLCGLPDSSHAGEHSKLVATAALEVTQALAGQRAAADAYVKACQDFDDALDKMTSQVSHDPPVTLSKDEVDSYVASKVVTFFQKDKDTLEKCAAIIRDAGATQTKMTSTYFAEGEKLKAAVRKLQEAWTDQMETQHHMKEGVTRCQPTVACVPSPCRGGEPSNPCEPWPECYPHPCQPWPACSTTIQGKSSDREADNGVQNHLFDIFTSKKNAEQYLSGAGTSGGVGGALMAPNSSILKSVVSGQHVAIAAAGGSHERDDSDRETDDGVQNHLFDIFTSEKNAQQYLSGAGTSGGAGGALMAPNSAAMALAGGSQEGDDSGDDPFDDAMFNVVHDCSLGGPGC